MQKLRTTLSNKFLNVENVDADSPGLKKKKKTLNKIIKPVTFIETDTNAVGKDDEENERVNAVKKHTEALRQNAFASPRMNQNQKRVRMFEMIKKVNKNDVDDNFTMAQVKYDHDPSMEFDSRGRLKRWVKVRQNSEE